MSLSRRELGRGRKNPLNLIALGGDSEVGLLKKLFQVNNQVAKKKSDDNIFLIETHPIISQYSKT